MKRLEEIFPDTDDVKIAVAAIKMLSGERLKRRDEIVGDLTSRARELGFPKNTARKHYEEIIAELRKQDYLIYDQAREDPPMRATANGKNFLKDEYGV